MQSQCMEGQGQGLQDWLSRESVSYPNSHLQTPRETEEWVMGMNSGEEREEEVAQQSEDYFAGKHMG